MAEGVTTKDFINVIQSLESRREDEAAKRSRQEEIRSGKEETQLNKIAEQLKTASGTQKKSLEAQQIQIRLDQEERRREGIQLSKDAQFIKDQKDAQAEIAKRIEANGGKAEENLAFLKRNNQIQIQELELRKQEASPSQRKEINKDLRKAQVEGLKLAFAPIINPLSTVAGFINKGIGKIIPGFTFGRLAGLVAIAAVIKFLRSDLFIDIIDALKEFKPENIVQNMKDAVFNLTNALAATVATVSAIAARVALGAGSGFGKDLSKTKLTAKDVKLKAGEEFKRGKDTFRVTGKGEIRRVLASGKVAGGFLPDQDKLIREFAETNQLGDRGKLVTGRGGTFFKTLKGIIKRVPFLAQFFAIQDLFNIFTGDMTPKEQFEQLTGILVGLGGGALGALLGGIIGSLGAIPTFGLSTLIGSAGGGVIGYFAGESVGKKLAAGIAEFALGMNVKSFPKLLPSIFGGYDINKLFNGTGERPGVKVDETPRTLEELKEGAKITTSNVSAIGESITPSITGKLPNLATSFTLQKAKMIEFEDAAFSAVETALAFGTKGNVNIQANEVNMSGTMLDKFANMLSEVFNFGGRNAGETASINTIIQGGDNNVNGGRAQVNVLANPDPVIQGITRQALF